MGDSDIIKDGFFVVAQMHDGDRSTNMLQITNCGEQKIGRTKVSVKQAVGERFGTIFQINKRKLEKVDDEDEFLDSISFDVNAEQSDQKLNIVVDNRGYVDSNTAQKLSNIDILKLKEDGASGAEIIKNLIENSDTWANKTEFAQEKWLKRKMKKYVCRMRLVKTTPATLCEAYHSKSRDKICGIRSDTLSQIVNFSGLHAGRNVLIVESCIGLLVGAAAYRMRGEGRILSVYDGQQPHYELVTALNLDSKFTDIIQPVSSNELAPAADYVRKCGFDLLQDIPLVQPLQNSTDTGTGTQQPLIKNYNSTGRNARDQLRVRSFLHQGAESLIIATRFDPLPILMECLALLAPSSPLVVYHEFKEPLLPCYEYLLKRELAVKIVLADSWLREFQVLPGRFHPQMHMSGSGGFLLYATYLGTGTGPSPSAPVACTGVAAGILDTEP